MPKINLTSIPLVSNPTENQTIKVSFRNFSDPDTLGSYQSAPDATVSPDGTITAPSPYNITTPFYKTVVKAVNNCGGSPATLLLTFCADVVMSGGTITPTTPTTFDYAYGFQAAPPDGTNDIYVDDSTVPVMENSTSGTAGLTADIQLNFASGASQRRIWLRVPANQAGRLFYQIGNSNSNPTLGQIEDFVFRHYFTIGSYAYLLSRSSAGFPFDASTQPVFIKFNQ